MLILSRRIDETIVIGDETTITILSVKGNQVRIGVTAPPEISVHREEIYQRIAAGETKEPINTKQKQLKEPSKPPECTQKTKARDLDKAWNQHRQTKAS